MELPLALYFIIKGAVNIFSFDRELFPMGTVREESRDNNENEKAED